MSITARLIHSPTPKRVIGVSVAGPFTSFVVPVLAWDGAVIQMLIAMQLKERDFLFTGISPYRQGRADISAIWIPPAEEVAVLLI